MLDIPFYVSKEEVRLRSDKHCYMICIKKKSKSKKDGYRWTPDKYYSSLRAAMFYLIDQNIKHSDVVSIKELIDTINKHYYEHMELFKKLRD